MKWLRTFGVLLFMGSCCHAPEAAEAPSVDIGESIYRRGVVASDAPLRRTRPQADTQFCQIVYQVFYPWRRGRGASKLPRGMH
jgi:hypothetical protein